MTSGQRLQGSIGAVSGDSNRTQLYGAFKRVRNSLRKYRAEDVVAACIEHLMDTRKGDVQRMAHYPPHLLLLLIKWAVLYGEHVGNGERLTAKRFHQVVNHMHDFSGAVRLPSEYDDPYLFFRNVAYQEFWYQESFGLGRLARESLIFGRLEPAHPFRRTFADAVGVSIEQFAELAISLATRFFVGDERFVDVGWFAGLQAAYPAGAIERFLDAVSADLNCLRPYLGKTHGEGRSLNYEFYEQTPLKRYPLLKRGDKYYCYSRNLLLYALQTFVYDTLRMADPAMFMAKFGHLFEDYVHASLWSAGVPLIREDELRRQLGCTGKAVDFVLADGDATVLVDAKGVELAELGMVTHMPGIVWDKVAGSVVKGMEQGADTAAQLAGRAELGGLRLGAGPKYLLVVSYKDLYVGTGNVFHHCIGKERMGPLAQRCTEGSLLPLQNMYFVSADDLDLLVGCVGEGRMGLAECLSRAVEDDASPESQKFVFRQHVWAQHPSAGLPRHLEDEIELVRERIRASLEGKHG